MNKVDELTALLEGGDASRIRDFFNGMREADRRSLAPACLGFLKEVRKEDFVESSPGTFTRNHLLPAAVVGVFCTATLSELSKVPDWILPADNEAFEIVADRKPPWLDAWVRQLLEADLYWRRWPLIRRLIREGMLAKPQHPNYFVGMISALARGERSTTAVKERLDEDPALLEEEVWQLFCYEGAADSSLANYDRFQGGAWAHALLAFIDEGKLSRSRLLDCSLEALQRDFNHYRAKWFASFYDALKPSADERRAHADVFLTLLGVSAPNIVSWAFKKVKSQASVYSAKMLVAGLRPVMEARSKGLVNNALKLLSKTAVGHANVRPEVVATAVVALGHEASEVQEAALALLEQNRDVEPPDTLATYAPLVAPSLRPRLTALLGEVETDATPLAASPPDIGSLPPHLRSLFGLDAIVAQPRDGVWRLGAASFDGTELPWLAGRAPIAAIDDLDELVDVAARVLEDAGGPDEPERVFDGLSRLCAQRPADFERRVSPLLKRAEQLMQRGCTPFSGEGPASDLCGLIHAWVHGEPATVELVEQHGHGVVKTTIGGQAHTQYAGNFDKTVGALSRRAYALSLRVAMPRSGLLLSAPTHTGALIDPRVLVERVNGWDGAPPSVLEVVVALLRLAPDHRNEACAALRSADEEWIQAIAHALGATVAVGPNVALWSAAARSRGPWRLDPAVQAAFPDVGPDVGAPAHYEVAFVPNEHGRTRAVIRPDGIADVHDDCLPVVFHRERGNSMWELGGFGGRTAAAIRWTASLWPTARESYFAGAFLQILNNLDWWEAQWYSKTLLEPLLDANVPLRKMGLWLLVTALAAKEPGEHGLATDAAIAAIEDGRLGSDNLGSALNDLLGSGLIKPGRWAKTLSTVAAASDAHAAVIKLSLEACLSWIAKPPRDFAKLLELLKELAIDLEHGVAGPNRSHLESVKGSSKVAKTARALLAVPVDDATRMRAAGFRLAAMRVEAASCRYSARSNHPADTD